MPSPRYSEPRVEITGVPIPYRHLKITFIADETVISQTEVKYGEKLDKVEMPDAPAGDGTFGKWPDISDQVMEGNLTLEAEYCDNITTLASTETVLVAEAGESKKPYAYIDGFYTDEAKLQVSVSEWTASQAKEEGVRPAAVSTFYGVKVSNADIGADTVSKLRLYRSYEKIKAVLIKTEDEGWQEISYSEYGQYIQVEMQGEEAEYCIVSEEDSLVWIYAGTAGVVFILVMLLIIRKRKRHNVKNVN